MADVRPFRGVRYAAAGLGSALCPPYDVIGPELAKSLRRRARNAVHLELPQGGGAARYARAAATWRRWILQEILTRDPRPSFYVVEERYRLGGRTRLRRGFLAALSTRSKATGSIIPHERTLSKPKADRLRMLEALSVNVSPIFGVFSDPSGSARRVLSAVVRTRPVARGRSHAGVSYRLWRVDGEPSIRALRRALAPRPLLIADGHHRYEVSRLHHRRTRRPGSEAVLAYLVADEDSGLAVLPTHRVAAAGLLPRAGRLARLKTVASLGALEASLARAKSPYAFGLVERGFHLGVPRSRGGCRSGLSVEWIARRLLAHERPEDLSYTPDAALAARKAEESGGAAVLVKPFSVAQVRRAARLVGLLPQKSTYFFPKIATGLVFRPLEP